MGPKMLDVRTACLEAASRIVAAQIAQGLFLRSESSARVRELAEEFVAWTWAESPPKPPRKQTLVAPG